MPEEKDDYNKNMKAVGMSILVIGLSITAVVMVYAAIGHNPNFSFRVMQDQADKTAEQYGLPKEDVSSGDLETPPSLRENTTAENATA